MAALNELFGDDSDDEQQICVSKGNFELHVTRPGVLTFHNGTEEALFLHVLSRAKFGDCDGILKAVDEFCYTVRSLVMLSLYVAFLRLLTY